MLDQFCQGVPEHATAVAAGGRQFSPTPGLASKARFLNLESHLGWANDMLALLCGGVEGTLAEQLGRSEAETKQWLEEKLGWLRGYAGEVRVWSYFQRVVKDAEEEIKRAGLSRTSWRRIKRRLIGESKLIGKERAFRRQVLAFVQKEGAKVPVRQRYLGSTHGRAGVVVWQVQRFGRTRSVSGDHGERVDDSTVGDSIDARAPSPGIRDRPRTGCRTVA